jgi:predicted nuclease of predicted toxin-antitoxin system
LRGFDDNKIVEYAKEKEAILVTKDIEFGSIILYPKDFHYGLLILRLPYFFTGKQIANVLKKFLEEVDVEMLVGNRTVLELGRYRMKEL